MRFVVESQFFLVEDEANRRIQAPFLLGKAREEAMDVFSGVLSLSHCQRFCLGE